jgi:hypothetical protein
MAISIVVQKQQTEGEEERRGDSVQNDLITTEAQAVNIGKQVIASFYFTRTARSISGIPYVGVKDGELALIDVQSISTPNFIHRITSNQISISLSKGIREIISVEGEYVNP